MAPREPEEGSAADHEPPMLEGVPEDISQRTRTIGELVEKHVGDAFRAQCGHTYSQTFSSLGRAGSQRRLRLDFLSEFLESAFCQL